MCQGRCAGGRGRSHPLSSSSVATTTLRVARPPPSSRFVHRPPPHTRTFPPPSSPRPPPSPVRFHRPDATALLSQQHHNRRPAPATSLTPRQYCWRRCPCGDGSVARVALVSSLSAGRPLCTGIHRAGVIVGQVGSRTEEVDC